MRVAVTNDDGIASPGLHALASAFLDAGHDVCIAAPAGDYSGHGAALGPLHRTGKIEFEAVEIDGVDVEAYAIDGPPALASLSLCLGGLGPKPELVVSGINIGANTGHAVLHSATIGAAFTASARGVPAIAVSQATGDDDGRFAWHTAPWLATNLVPFIGELAYGEVFNLNVPNCALGSVVDVVPAGLDRGGVVQGATLERGSGVLELQIPDGLQPAPGTDTALLASGFATLTVLAGVQESRFTVHGAVDDIARQLGHVMVSQAVRDAASGNSYNGSVEDVSHR